MPAKRRAQRPATTPENREAQMVSLAMDLAERQIRDGSASAQVITHFIRAGSSREKLEHERLRKENALLAAKVEQLASAKRTEDLYANALRAMRRYSGQEEADEDDEY